LRLRSKGDGLLGIELSLDRWRHVTVNGQGRDPYTLSLI